jgi:peptidoglycan/LPS O-acetylase OafA/YrhL
MTKSSNDIYFKQLNGIRFIAVFLVLLDHWLVPVLPIPLGHLGVVIFFVLSGFLITRILFLNADDIQKTKSSVWPKIIRFIYRRSLRIFPIYFILLFIGLIFNISNFKEIWPWLISYSPNLYIMFKGQWLGTWDHLWSLAVEEQYYLIFPYFILFSNKNRYVRLFVIMISLGILSRLIFYILVPHEVIEKYWMFSYVNPLSAIDCFGMGGLLAYYYHYDYNYLLKIAEKKNLLPISISAVFISLILSNYSSYTYDNIWFSIFERSISAIFAYFLILNALMERNNYFGKLLENKVVIYLGSISYGIYLYHNLVFNYYHLNGNTIWGFLSNNFNYLNSLNLESIILKFVINFLLLVGIASFSWFYIEKPINRLKNKL